MSFDPTAPQIGGIGDGGAPHRAPSPVRPWPWDAASAPISLSHPRPAHMAVIWGL